MLVCLLHSICTPTPLVAAAFFLLFSFFFPHFFFFRFFFLFSGGGGGKVGDIPDGIRHSMRVGFVEHCFDLPLLEPDPATKGVQGIVGKGDGKAGQNKGTGSKTRGAGRSLGRRLLQCGGCGAWLVVGLDPACGGAPAGRPKLPDGAISRELDDGSFIGEVLVRSCRAGFFACPSVPAMV